MNAIQRGDTVRRVDDHSGRTRRVIEIQTDADGAQHITLDEFLDGWLIYNANELTVVSNHVHPNKTHLQSPRQRERAHRRERSA